MRLLKNPVAMLILFAAPIALYMGEWRVGVMQESVRLSAIAHGVALTPFQYRVLMPWILGKIADWQSLPSLHSLVVYYESLVAFVIPLALYAYCSRICRNNWLSLFFALGFFYLYPFLYIYSPPARTYYASDAISIFLFTLGLLFIHDGRYWKYYAVLAAGMFNRETIALLLPVFGLVQYGKMPYRSFFLHLLAQLLLVAGIKFLLYMIFRNNAGAGMYSLDMNILQAGLPASFHSSRIYTNISMFGNWSGIAFMSSFMGYLWLPLLIWWNRTGNDFAMRTLWLVPLFMLGMFVVGNLWEFRIYGELVPIFLGALCCIAAGTLRNLQGAGAPRTVEEREIR